MKRLLSVLALVAALMFGAGTVAAPGGLSLFDDTSAAWVDHTHASAVITAGTWTSTTTNGCTAYGQDGKVLPGCAVSGITYLGWGEAGKQTRNYYINFQTPSGTRSVAFDVDLNTATGKGTSWSWKNASVLAGAQFTPRDGWTCGQLPRVRGTGADWQVTTIFFQVAEAGTASRCS
ncbi:hypothetical protein [Microbacterium sp. KHB019]|uniref:hypothetical protein n=1 Tax=Microbacterium sp. KHB019 TaxID=3129770 RepID=UPI003078AB4C